MRLLRPFCFFLSSLFAAVSAPAQGLKVPAGSIAWSASRPLTVADFQGRPHATESHAALTSAFINTGATCHHNVFAGTARASFDPARSWVRDAGAMTPKLLHHEQLHFDIAEVYARRLRQQLSALHTTCTQLGNRFDEISAATYAAWEQAEADYDHDTNHGLLPAPQARWEALVQQQLAELAAFAEEDTQAVVKE